jgi:hypothetical protein
MGAIVTTWGATSWSVGPWSRGVLVSGCSFSLRHPSSTPEAMSSTLRPLAFRFRLRRVWEASSVCAAAPTCELTCAGQSTGPRKPAVGAGKASRAGSSPPCASKATPALAHEPRSSHGLAHAHYPAPGLGRRRRFEQNARQWRTMRAYRPHTSIDGTFHCEPIPAWSDSRP